MNYKPLPIDPFVLGYYLVGGNEELDAFIKNKGYKVPLQLDNIEEIDFSNGLPCEYLQSSIDQRKSLFYGLLSSASISNGVALCTIDKKLLKIFE
jgi:hypothetical protein